MNPYDLNPWDGEPCAVSHPDHLFAIARLFGLSPAPVTACRVLELGCASGANLIPMAAALPHSSFVGVDLSVNQIAAGQKEIEALGLGNIRLRVGDLAALPADLGQFDAVIAQGVFSWVPRAAQEGLLRAARGCLTEHGVAYVSYSALPGAAVGLSLREMLRWHVRDERDPARRVELARRYAEFIAANVSPRAPHAAAIRRLVGELGGLSDAHVLHDHLSDTQDAMSLSTFVGRARDHGLQYLGDAQLHTMFGGELDPEVEVELRSTSASQVDFEQAHDFLTHRPFRTSLLCRAERAVDHHPTVKRLEGSFLSCRAQPTDPESGRWAFRSPGRDAFETDDPLVGTALQRLVEAWPRPLGFEALCGESAGGREALGQNLLAAAMANLVELGTSDRGIAGSTGPAPRGFSVARAEVQAGRSFVTNLWHERVELEPGHAALLSTLDGKHSVDPPLNAALEALAAKALLQRV